MTRSRSCAREPEVLDLVWTSQWPARADRELVEHVATCAVCADLATVASAIGELGEVTTTETRVPDASAVWYRAQVRARQERERRAARPVLAMQLAAALSLIALVAIAWGMLGPLVTEWWTARPGMPALTMPTLPEWSAVADASAASGWHWMLAAALAWAVLVPAAFYIARIADRTTEPHGHRRHQ